MRPTFDHTVTTLIQAYLKDELQHGDCEGCAVGNIVHAAGYPRYNMGGMPPDSCGKWRVVFFTFCKKQIFGSEDDWDFYAGLQMVHATGYSVKELARVEYAFETAPYGGSLDDWMFNGLMAVVDVLADIHGVEQSEKSQALDAFSRVHQSKVTCL